MTECRAVATIAAIDNGYLVTFETRVVYAKDIDEVIEVVERSIGKGNDDDNGPG